MSEIENVSRRVVQTDGEDYLEFDAGFRQKSLCMKLWLLLVSMPRHVWYSYFAPQNERYEYRALLSYLERQREKSVEQ